MKRDMASCSFGWQSLVPNYQVIASPPPQKKLKGGLVYVPNPIVMFESRTMKQDPNDAIVVPMGGIPEWHRKFYPNDNVIQNKSSSYDPDKDCELMMKLLKDKGIPIQNRKEQDHRPFPLEHEMTDEELWKFCEESDYGAVDIEPYRHELPKLRQYHKQVHESEGFDIDEMPNIGIPPYGPLKVNCCPERYEMYKKLAQFALDEAFNNDYTDTEFMVTQVKSVNVNIQYAITYLITFTAAGVVKFGGSDAATYADANSDCKTFQAAVQTWSSVGYDKKSKTVFDEKFKTVEICRIKG